MKTFQHKPLSSAATQIRLIALDAVGDSDDIWCTLITASLEENPSYLAASYEWGETEPLVDILV